MAYKSKYLPTSLSPSDRRRQLRSIRSKTILPRPKVSYPRRRSSYTLKFQKKYGKRSIEWIGKHLIRPQGILKILKKGRGAYRSSGSRPNTTADQWARARLYSVILNGPARQVDKDIWNKYRRRKKSSKKKKTRTLSGGKRPRPRRISYVEFRKSPNKTKKMEARFYSKEGDLVKRTSFGARGYSDYTIHKDKDRQLRYLRRHRKREDWKRYTSPGSLSRYVLWGDPSLKRAKQKFAKKFKLKLRS